jgi:hypothetical protein
MISDHTRGTMSAYPSSTMPPMDAAHGPDVSWSAETFEAFAHCQKNASPKRGLK